MSTRETLQELARQVRRDTIRILDAAAPAWLTYAPPGTSNHILWHAGHAVWLQEVLCERLIGGGGELPPGWDELFGMNCRPPSQTKHWPGRDRLREILRVQLDRILGLLASVSDDGLARIADPSRGSATVADRIIHGFHDEAKHCGEMYLLLKLCHAHSGGQA